MKKPVRANPALSMLGLAVLCIAPCAKAQSWQGPYAGGEISSSRLSGHGETILFDTDLNGSYEDSVNTFSGTNAFSTGFCAGVPGGKTPVEGCLKDDSEVGLGLRFGYDWQGGAWVYGVLADVTGLKMSDSVTAFSTTPASYTFTRQIDSLAAVRGRLGYVFDHWLVFGSMGYAWADLDRRFATSNGLNSFAATDGKDGKGMQYGFGVETRLDARWSLGLEYLHTSLNDKGVVVRAGPSASTFASNPFLIVNASGTDLRRSHRTFAFDSLTLTATYHFGDL